jgi:hypothetical protein
MAAAGIGRGEAAPDWIRRIEMAVRIDQEGSELRDFQTINPPPRHLYRHLSTADRLQMRAVVQADGVERKHAVLTERDFRQDQTVLWFLDDPGAVALSALTSPRFTLYAGRKSCPFSFPMVLGTTALSLEAAVATTATVAHTPRAVEAIFFQPTASLPTTPVSVGIPSDHTDFRCSAHVDPPLANDWFAVAKQLNQGETSCG